MRKVILMMLLAVVSSSAMAESTEILKQIVEEGIKVIDILLELDKDSYFHNLRSTGQCIKEHDYITKNVPDQIMAELIHFSIDIDDCHDKKGAEAHLLRAAQNGSLSAKQELRRIEKRSSMMVIDDLKVDIDSLQGRKVGVKGIGQYIMDSFILKKNSMDTNPIFVDISNLDRDQRKEILQICSNFMAGCGVTVYGTVGQVNHRNVINAEDIEWD